jgi:imidazolonepropionase-like amidohydrolase
MKARGMIVLLLAAGGGQPVGAQVVAIRNVSVVDANDTVPRDNQTVILRGNRITEIARDAAVPAGARIIDGAGKYLVPGFWDMHVHLDVVHGRELLALYVFNGVTGVRDMAGAWNTLKSWRADVAAGRLAGPRIVASGPYLEGGATPIPHILARNPDEGARGVDSLVSLGVDLVKVHGRLSPPTFFAIARRARERAIPFAGHVSQTIGAQAASDSGLRSVEHLLGVPMPCTPAESIALRPRFPIQAALGRCRSIDLAPTYASFVRNNTWVTPTFTAAVEIARWPRRDLPGDSLARYLPDTLRRFVLDLFPMPDSIPPNADSAGLAVLARRMTQVVEMRRAGVGIMTGTDAPLRNSPPGFGLLEEMSLLARGGLSNRDVLRAATLEPARYLAATDSMGLVRPGMLADLVLLDGNPLAAIENTRRIHTVIANGRVFTPADRRRIIAGLPK